MSTLLLRLAGPLQSWGDSSRFAERHTRREPTRSGVVGMLAAAQGRRRTDPLEDLVGLEFAIRVDQLGTVLRDFHTAIRWDTRESMPLSQRYYLEDSVFVVAVGGDPGLIEGLANAVRRPRWAPYLGRRSCPPSRRIFLGVVAADVRSALRGVEWQASMWHRRAHPEGADLLVRADARMGERGSETRRDVPKSFDPRGRQYAWREIVELDPVRVQPPAAAEPDFMTPLEV